MGLLDRLLGREESIPENRYECDTCGATYETARRYCEKCAGRVREAV